MRKSTLVRQLRPDWKYYDLESPDDYQLITEDPVAGFSFESFVIEEIIRGLQSTMATQLSFNYYITIDKSEVDLIVENSYGAIPIEIKLNSVVNRKSLRGLEIFKSDMHSDYAIVVNRGKRVELLSENIVQIPVQYL